MLALYLSTLLLDDGGEPVPTGLLAEFRLRFPAFAPVADATVQYWIDDQARLIGANWPAPDNDIAIITLAAHQLASFGLGQGDAPAGVTSFRSGTFSVTMSDKAASATGYSSTIYGRQYLAMCQRLFGGIRLVRTSDYV